MSKVTEIHIEVQDNLGRTGTLEIFKGINTRTILIKLEDDTVVLEQVGVETVPHYQVGVVTGKLHRILPERKVSAGKWKVRDFVLSFDGDKRGQQYRLFQAVGDVIDKLATIPLGTNIVAEVRFMGKEWFNKNPKRNCLDYWNLDEVHAIHTF